MVVVRSRGSNAHLVVVDLVIRVVQCVGGPIVHTLIVHRDLEHMLEHRSVVRVGRARVNVLVVVMMARDVTRRHPPPPPGEG